MENEANLLVDIFQLSFGGKSASKYTQKFVNAYRSVLYHLDQPAVVKSGFQPDTPELLLLLLGSRLDYKFDNLIKKLNYLINIENLSFV